ncbi:MAG TPA: hypothetical protein DCE58_04465 [Cryomorphaceae bacterium]|nr:hypothetical protein [Cryomorphaceae bacterium]
MGSNTSPEWVLLFDGPCPLCQRAIRWLMHRDRRKVLCYTPLHSAWTAEWKRRHAPDVVWPDEVVLVQDGHYWFGADAIAITMQLLPFPYSFLGTMYRFLPGRKKIYRWLAQHRYTWFGKKEPLLTTCLAPRSWREPRPHSC